jgi:hypothetical protein
VDHSTRKIPAVATTTATTTSIEALAAKQVASGPTHPTISPDTGAPISPDAPMNPSM